MAATTLSGRPLGILVRRAHKHVAAFSLHFLRVPGRHRHALHLSAPDSIFHEMMSDADSHPFDIALQIQAGLLELDLNRPMANAVKIADADALAFEILQRLDVRRTDPDVGMLVAPSRDDVEIGAASALVKHRARLNIERYIHRFLFHRLSDGKLFQAEGQHGIMGDCISQRSIGGLQALVVEIVHFMSHHHRDLMQHVITDGRDAQFAVEHGKTSLSKNIAKWPVLYIIRLPRGDVGSSGHRCLPDARERSFTCRIIII